MRLYFIQEYFRRCIDISYQSSMLLCLTLHNWSRINLHSSNEHQNEQAGGCQAPLKQSVLVVVKNTVFAMLHPGNIPQADCGSPYYYINHPKNVYHYASLHTNFNLHCACTCYCVIPTVYTVFRLQQNSVCKPSLELKYRNSIT